MRASPNAPDVSAHVLHVLAAVTTMFCAAPALAAPDAYATGDGHSGPLNVSAQGQVVNSGRALAETAQAGATELAVTDADQTFSVGDLVLIWQATGPTSAVPGGDAAIDLSGNGIGRFLLARLVAVESERVLLDTPSTHALAANDTQLVIVPEYTTLTVNENASLVAPLWDPVAHTGGVLALFVQGTAQVDGALDASGRGHRGGEVAIDNTSAVDCSELVLTPPQGGARGQGLGYPFAEDDKAGRGNFANGGGGGVCVGAGGGGGALLANGGQGGASTSNADVGGLGGARLFASVEPIRL
ncbi:MAG TPA: hypothetical protein VMF89_03920, partial [Polyangiales bacterium]|nr:hypothetical protein [Polyangiales bacterium]